MRSILLIEAKTDMLENLTAYFEPGGYHILSTECRKKGLALAKEFFPDLVICDMPKPGLDGQEFLPLLIEQGDRSKIPFIFNTSLDEIITEQKPWILDLMILLSKTFEPRQCSIGLRPASDLEEHKASE